jgi:hypothetical protein
MIGSGLRVRLLAPLPGLPRRGPAKPTERPRGLAVGRSGLTWYFVNSVPIADSSEVMPPNGRVTVRSGLSLKRQISGNSRAHPSNGIGMMQKPPKQISGKSNANVRSRMSHLMSSSAILIVLSPRRSTEPFSRWNLMWYEAVSGPSDALSECSKTALWTIASKSFLNAFSLAASQVWHVRTPPTG